MRETVISALSVSILLLLAGVGIPTITSPEIKVDSQQNIYDNSSVGGAFSGTSFHGNTTIANANWYVVKLSSSSPFHLEEINISVGYFQEKNRRVRFGFLFTNFQGKYYGWTGGMCFANPEDRFIHINIGPINYTYNNLKYWEHGSDEEAGGWIKWCDISFTFESGDWYLICIAGVKTVSCHWDVRINTTEEVEIAGTTEGNTSFIYGAEDFLGNLNIMGPWILVTINGEKKIRINNTLVAFFYKPPGGGFLKYQYIAPNGTKKTYLVWDFSLLRLPIPLKRDFDVHAPVIGVEGKGEWTFKMGLCHWIYIGYPIKHLPPPVRDAELWGADVKLP